MITIQPTASTDLLEFTVTGKVTDEDYTAVLMPAIDAAIEAHDHIRMLARFDAGFQGYSFAAMLDDASMGLKHWSGFDRCAIVTDTTWLRLAAQAFAPVMPCPVRVFPLGQEEEARRWLRESLGAIHQIDLGDGVVQIRLIGKLDAAAYAGEAGDLDAFIRANDHFRLLIDLREFDGWQGLSALGQHFKLARAHIPLVERAAILGNKPWQRLAERVGAQIIGKPVRFFDADSFDAAVAFLKSADSAGTAA